MLLWICSTILRCNEVYIKNFIGLKSSDGLLTITGVYGKINRNMYYYVHCEICSKDTELFPNGILARASDILNGVKPCACADKPRYSPDQWLIIAQRRSPCHIKILGYAEEFYGSKTLVARSCVIHGAINSVQLKSLSNSSCKLCCDNLKRSEFEFIEKFCQSYCDRHNYEFIGFLNGYKNVKSKFTYKCPFHGLKTSNYAASKNDHECLECSLEKSGYYGLYEDRKMHSDTLYILDFNGEFIKVGRSFNMSTRINALKSASGFSNINIINLYYGLHKDVYAVEQSLIEFLRLYCLAYESPFTKESFVKESIDYIKYFMDSQSLLTIKE